VEWYAEVSESIPWAWGTEQIDSRWADSEGKICYKTFGVIKEGVGTIKGEEFRYLIKLSKGGTVFEMMIHRFG